ncbi:MAG: MFS transporter [Eubacteriales bacterium]|nr:MFS transporter [Eubacteriales bacterium]
MKLMKNQRLLPIAMLGYLFVLGLDTGGLQKILLEIAEEYELSYVKMSGLVTAKCTANFICILIFGPVSDKVGKKRILLGAAAVFAAGCLMAAGSSSFEMMAAAIVLIGMAFGVCEGLSSALLADVFPQKREQILTLSQGMYSCGAVLGPFLSSIFMKYTPGGWRTEFGVLAFLMVGMAGLLWTAKIPITSGLKNTGENNSANSKDKGGNYKMTLAVVAVLFGAMLLYSGMENGLGYFMDTIFDRGYGAAELSAFAISGMWLAMLISRMICATAKNGQERIVFSALIACTVISAGLLHAENEKIALLLCILAGAAFGPVWPMLIGFAMREMPECSGTVTSWMAASSAIGASVFPLFMGKAADYWNNEKYAVGIFVMISMAAAGMFGLYKMMIRRGMRDERGA